jgi:hypothetical protein
MDFRPCLDMGLLLNVACGAPYEACFVNSRNDRWTFPRDRGGIVLMGSGNGRLQVRPASLVALVSSIFEFSFFSPIHHIVTHCCNFSYFIGRPKNNSIFSLNRSSF